MAKYKVSELAELLGVSEPAIRKKVKRGDYETVEETINNRSVTLIVLSDTKLEALKEQVRINKNTYKIVDQTTVESTQNVSYGSDEVESVVSVESSKDNFDKLMDFTERYLERLDNLYEANSEQGKKLYLLEDKQREQASSLEYYKNEYFKLEQENERLKLEVDALKKELEDAKKPFWKRK